MPKLIPVADALSKPFWDAVNQRRLVLQHCGEVGRVSDHKVRRDATEHALDIRRDRAVAAEQTVPPEQPQIASL